MYIELYSLTEFWGGAKFTLPSKLVRFIEFENVVVFLLDEDGKKDKIIGVKFSQEGGINHFYIAWEFQIIDKKDKKYAITALTKRMHKEQELVYCASGWADVGCFLNPETGEVVDFIPIR